MQLDSFLKDPITSQILLYIFVHSSIEKAQLKKRFSFPVDAALKQLTHQGLITHLQAYYRLNDNYAHIDSLIQQLHQLYHLQSHEDKKLYYVTPTLPLTTQTTTVQIVWQQLKKITSFQRHTYIDSKKKWSGSGTVSVSTTLDTLTLHEEGYWHVSTPIFFSNTFVYTLNQQSLSLAYKRIDPVNPTFLFHLSADTTQRLSSIQPHVCHHDDYYATLTWNAEMITLNCRILGPKKNETLEYIYLSTPNIP